MTAVKGPNAREPIADFIWQKHCELLNLGKRLYFLEHFLSDLTAMTRRKPFRIWNDIQWGMVHDTLDMLIIDLASWAHGQGAKKFGLFWNLEHHYLGDLRLQFLSRPGETTSLAAMVDAHVQAAHSRLFPTGVKRPTPGNIRALGEAHRGRARGLRDDRSKNRAHRFEKTGAATRLTIVDVRRDYDHCRQMLNDLRLVATRESMAEQDMNRASARKTAERITDDIVLPDLPRYRAPPRLDAYESLHADHDDPSKLFNDPRWRRERDA